MGIYSNLILPWVMEKAMSKPELTEYRKQLLSSVTGEVLEIGAGTGLNFLLYPDSVQKLTAIDPNPGMKRIADRKIEQTRLSIDYRILNGEELPMEENTFDSVVSAWTLCSIPRVDRAISEIHRVLKPNGKFYFIEHGLSDDPKVQVWQNRLTPIQKIIGDGCHLNRPIRQLIENTFDRVDVEEFYLPNIPKIVGYLDRGVAIK